YLPYATESKTDSYLKYDFGGSNTTNYSSHTTTDSCAGGTQVLAGYKTRYGYISLDVDGAPVMNHIEAAHNLGWKTAVVTNDNIVDATPAAAMIHDTNRYHSDVLYYKALKYALAEQGLDLLMGWDWGMSSLFATGSWTDKFLSAEKEGIKDAVSRENIAAYNGGDPIAYFEGLSTADKMKMAGFSVYYSLWENEDPANRLNSFMTWSTTGSGQLSQYLTWLKGTGLKTAIAKVESELPNPSEVVNRFTSFKATLANEDTDFTKPVLGSWTSDGNDYESSSPNRGYTIHGTIGKNYPSWPEMVAYTIYQMDKEAAAADTGFYAMIENTCTDGWGHSGNYDTKAYSMMNEVQCFDEGVAIAVKYVLEHPDTLLVITADHETGGFRLRTGWEEDFSLITSTTTGHSSQRVPLYAFGAGADKFSAENILAKYGSDPKAGLEQNGKIHEGWITGAIIGELMTGSAFGQTGLTEYKGQAIDHGTSDEPYGNALWNPAI
ncbi:MAG: alkaline phosphatase, partial [Spirochaetales bacterium]|nr:alkaline phosphatase [Spirochaetales bacterium]